MTTQHGCISGSSLSEVRWKKSGKCSKCGEVFWYGGHLAQHIIDKHTNKMPMLRHIYAESRGSY